MYESGRGYRYRCIHRNRNRNRNRRCSPFVPLPLPLALLLLTALTTLQRIAKDVYNTYLFFSLTCRLPILCMALSTVSLMSFLLAVAWTAWPTAVLVMSFVAGFLLTSQFVVFGIHRLINFGVWTVRVAWRAVVRRSGRGVQGPPEAQLRPQAHAQVQVQAQAQVQGHGAAGGHPWRGRSP